MSPLDASANRAFSVFYCEVALQKRLPEVMLLNSWVQSIPPPERAALLESAVRVVFKPGVMLYRSGDPPGIFYGLAAGQVKISTLREDGREAILSILEPGTWFGEMSMVDGLPRTHDATAQSKVELLAVRQPDFDRLMLQPVFAGSIARLLSSRMRLLFAVFEDATLFSTQARVARRLLLLSRGDAMLSSERRRVVKVSQATLAMMLGITRQTLSMELQLMVESGAIALGYRTIELRSHAALIRLSNGSIDTETNGSKRVALDEARKPVLWAGDERRSRSR